MVVSEAVSKYMAKYIAKEPAREPELIDELITVLDHGPCPVSYPAAAPISDCR